MVAIYGVWHIWKERCRRVFQHSSLPENLLIDLLRDDILLLGTHLARRAYVLLHLELHEFSDTGE